MVVLILSLIRGALEKFMYWLNVERDFDYTLIIYDCDMVNSQGHDSPKHAIKFLDLTFTPILSIERRNLNMKKPFFLGNLEPISLLS
mgnify:CR=1 FL=1